MVTLYGGPVEFRPVPLKRHLVFKKEYAYDTLEVVVEHVSIIDLLKRQYDLKVPKVSQRLHG